MLACRPSGSRSGRDRRHIELPACHRLRHDIQPFEKRELTSADGFPILRFSGVCTTFISPTLLASARANTPLRHDGATLADRQSEMLPAASLLPTTLTQPIALTPVLLEA